MRTPEADAAGHASLPRFQRAAQHASMLGRLMLVAVSLGICLAGLLRWLPMAGLQSVLAVQLAMLLVWLASAQALWWVTRWRTHALQTAETRVVSDAAAEFVIESDDSTTGARLLRRWCNTRTAVSTFLQRHLSADARSAIGMVLLSIVALLLIVRYSNRMLIAATGTSMLLLASSLLMLAFVQLVMERYCAGNRMRELPEARQLAYVLRVGIAVSVLLGAALLFATEVKPGETRQWPMFLVRGVAWLPAAIALEYLLRALLSIFTPPQQHEPELLSESLIAGMWRWPLRPLHHLQTELKQRFGIDLRQSWAFAYIRRALLPVIAVLLGIAWLLSGMLEIPLDARGIYERFGKPVAVLPPGLHIGLPWPMARLRLVENGVVHELVTASASPDEQRGEESDAQKSEQQAATAEGAAPSSANRLWDASHVAEKSQIIASDASTPDGRQSFQIVNMDVRFMYRIGLRDVDALDATYNSVDVPTLVRSTANRILVSYFASRTLDGVLGERRVQLARDIGAQVQRDLDTLNSGVEIMATVVEAIHPPAAAANAYHSVQAAQITAQAIIARERGSAAEQVNLAQLRAGMARDQASAAARETLASAEVAERRFAAERVAYQQAGKAFLLEQYLGQLSAGLSNAQLVIVDHRLRAASASIDLRTFAAPLDGVARTTQESP